MIFVILSMLVGYVYEDADSLIIYNDSLTICGNHQYNIKVQITNNGKVKVNPWKWNWPNDSIGWLFLDAPLIQLQNSSSISGSECGYEGGSMANHPMGYGPGFGSAGGLSGGGGGGAAYGGNGGKGGDYYGGAGGIIYGDISDTLIDIGSGGGAGRLSLVDGAGGDGGAKIYLRAKKILIDSSYICADGQRGFDGNMEAGGGGAGGGIIIRADSFVINNSMISARGGDGGDALYGGGGGGAAGGRIKLFYSAFLDTANIVLSVQKGAGGLGSYVLPDSGQPGSIYIGPITCITEGEEKTAERFIVQTYLIKKTIKITIENPPMLVKLYDISGRHIKTFWLEHHTEMFNLTDLNQGVYFLHSHDHNRYVAKIILLD